MINLNKDLKQTILEIVGGEARPIPSKILFTKLIKKNKKHNQISINSFNLALNELIDSYQIKKLKSGSLVLGYINGPIDKSKKLIGTIRINQKGCGFITPEGADHSEYYVFITNLNGALDGDKINFYPMKKDGKNELIDAVVDQIIEHNKKFYVCIFNLNADGTYQILADANNLFLPIELDDITGLVNGQKILVQIIQFTKDKLYGTVSRIIGHKDDVGVDILSIVLDKGVEVDFSQELLEQSKSLKFKLTTEQLKLRHDLREKNIVTIDPKTSKDFDDAFCVEKTNDGHFKLFVAIADVAYYVPYHSLLDETAKKRGTSIYLVDRVIPMLPHILSDDICSLKPNVDRFATVCEMGIDQNGAFVDIQTYPAIINSKRRFNYDEVNDYFKEKNKLQDDDLSIKQMLNTALKLHKVLEKTKYARGYINFNIPEVEILLDKNGFPNQILVKHLDVAQHLIENFMLAANQAVTLFCEKHQVPFIYRIHDKPNTEKIKSLVCETKKLNFNINTDLDNIQPKDVASWFKNNQDNPNLDLIAILILRAMAKAEYSVKNIGHFGLALDDYTHYTSPIRRYPDLMVGRLLWMYIFDRKKYSDKDRRSFVSELEELCELSSKNELIAIDCERDVNEMKFAEYMSRHIGENFKGFVNGVTKFGVFVELPNTIEGLIRVDQLGDDYFVFNEDTNEMIGRRTGVRYTIGTKVEVEVIAADKQARQINFKLVKHLGNR